MNFTPISIVCPVVDSYVLDAADVSKIYIPRCIGSSLWYRTLASSVGQVWFQAIYGFLWSSYFAESTWLICVFMQGNICLNMQKWKEKESYKVSRNNILLKPIKYYITNWISFLSGEPYLVTRKTFRTSSHFLFDY